MLFFFRWGEVAGLCEAKSVLQEAMVLPLLLPDYFKVIYNSYFLLIKR